MKNYFSTLSRGRSLKSGSFYCGTLLSMIFLAIGISGCSSSTKTETAQKSLQSPNLTETQAKMRKEMIGAVDYDLEFKIGTGDKFSGVSKINFELKSLSKDLRVDFFGDKVTSLSVNSQEIPIRFDGQGIWISKSQLKKGKNEIRVGFERKYSTNGSGLTRFMDPEDKQYYLHTQLQPFYANHVFPSFDQPDLKASYKTVVVAPNNWQVVTATREESVIRGKNGLSTWIFPKSRVFSTYLWSLHAGPFKVWTDKAGKIPLRLMARPSLAKYVDVKNFMKFTKQGFKYFNKYFDYDYPYEKYDQLIVPAFNAGAMENVAAVTFTERLVNRGSYSDQDRQYLAEIIYHEMAHMWFGNLVTMAWWDDLWLNESFATFMASKAMAETPPFQKVSWKLFHGTKQWAYWEDQLVTTHPILVPVPDTAATQTIFDGITYGKGASVIQQLNFFIGPDSFRKGVQAYFKKHANQNTVLNDFMSAMEKASGKDLKKWNQKWLKTASLNQIAAEYSCESGRIKEMTFKQSFVNSDYQTLRPHRFEVALMKMTAGKLKAMEIETVSLDRAEAVAPQFIGKTCPDLVFANFNDHGYFLEKISPKSTQKLLTQISKVQNSHARLVLWNSLWDMVRNAELPLDDFAKAALNEGLAKDSDDVVLRSLLRKTARNRGYSVLSYYYAAGPKAEAQRKAFLKKYDRIIWARLQSAKPRSEIQKALFESFITTASTPLALKRVKRLLSKSMSVRGYKVSQDDRWKMIRQLAQYNQPGVKALIEAEAKKDVSSQGKTSRLASLAILPDWDSKKQWIGELTKTNTDFALYELRAIAGSLFPANQEELRAKYSPEFFKDLSQVNENQAPLMVKNFTKLAPYPCRGNMNLYDQELKRSKDISKGALKRLKIQKQEAGRCQKIIQKL